MPACHDDLVRQPAAAVNLPSYGSPRRATAARSTVAGGQANRQHSSRFATGFTLIEILIAIFILAIGLLGLACVFPVAANDTRIDAEHSIANGIAQNAVSIIKAEYTASDMTYLTNPATTLQPLPNMLTNLPASQRAYAFNQQTPYPTGNPALALYFWTALVRRTPGSANRYDLFIFVFKKGAVEQTYGGDGSVPVANGTLEAGDRLPGETYIPMITQGSVGDAAFSMGSEGVGLVSGTVFRKIPAAGGIGETTPTLPNEPVAYVPPADGTTASPLVYIYQTTVGF